MSEEFVTGMRARLDARGIEQGFAVRLAATTTLKQPLGLCVLAVNAQGQAIPGYLMHARAPVSPCGSVRRLLEGEGFLFSPTLFPPELAKLWLFLYLAPVETPGAAHQRTLAVLRPSRLEVWKSPPPVGTGAGAGAGAGIGHHSFDSTNYQNHQTVQLLEIYQNHQRDGWRIYFPGTGHRQSIEQICQSCGINAMEGDFLPAVLTPADAAPDVLPKVLLQRPPAGSVSAPAGSVSAPVRLISAPPPAPPIPQAILPPQAVPRPPALPPEARRPLYRPAPLDRFQPGSIRIGVVRAGQVGVSVDGVPVDPAAVRMTPEGDGRRVRVEGAGSGALIQIYLEEPA